MVIPKRMSNIEFIKEDSICLVRERGKLIKSNIKGLFLKAYIRENIKIHLLYRAKVQTPLKIVIYIRLDSNWFEVLNWSSTKKTYKFLDGGWVRSLRMLAYEFIPIIQPKTSQFYTADDYWKSKVHGGAGYHDDFD